MKIVFDTNVIISNFVANGICSEVFQVGIFHHDCFISEFILNECITKFGTKFKYSTRQIAGPISILKDNFTFVEPEIPKTLTFKDPQDLPILGTAIAANATALITGDRELLALKKIHRTQIVPPRDVWQAWTGGIIPKT